MACTDIEFWAENYEHLFIEPSVEHRIVKYDIFGMEWTDQRGDA